MMLAPLELGARRFDWSRPLIFAVLNVTHDSFSDGGRYLAHEDAVQRALTLVDEGADVIDVGGESTRPGAEPVGEDEELRRVVSVVRSLAERGVLVSVDTTKRAVARAALEAGAVVLNDVGMGDSLAELAAEAARFDAAYLRMHSRGTPSTMRTLADYPHGVVTEVRAALAHDALAIESAGVSRAKILLDPGIGFAKSAAQSLEVLAGLDRLVSLGYPICVGPSRKSFIDDPRAYAESWGSAEGGAQERLGGTAAAVTASVLAGAHAVRVHDVRAMRQAARVAHGIAQRTRALK